MHASIFIARLLVPMYVVVGMALLTKPQSFHAILSEFIGSVTLLYLAGFIGLLAGTALLVAHNVWVTDWRLMVTLIGWIILVRALITIFKPEWIVAVGRAILARPEIFAGAGATNLVIGAVLCYFGYVG
ncbi:MAG TPA: hypothetical protein VEI06_07300 [Gemmatimonadaceae bacterium]|nr:hypothetical protein [Gemmatimonadaceae bacterium]